MLLFKISNPLVNEAHATSLRGKYTRAGLFLCNVYTLVGYAKPLLARPTIPMAGPTNSIPQTSHSTLFIEQPFCAAWEPILQYDWNSRFHTQAPGLHLFSVCLIPGGQSLQLAGAELCSPNSSHLNTLLSAWLILAQRRKIAKKVIRNTFMLQFCPT